ncbi:MAG TPA: rRNA cytosine-C5-methyltransferase [Nocardioides bacterium]|uniref:RsmB/NOP family class I SAM-dependent RNA methyltransferase n=1 Tax=uncultured Nocardioides sp. TaxID=198441 RepID=UPI000ECA4BCA|nr:transcription antitermination factor NusB [uncultured Nocardioides sp.]HCB06900.1 rRNA cytosine-C5-methyltransferase [Nocardioides sp.]
MAEPRSRAQGRGTAPAAAPGGRRIVLDPARAAALDVLKAVRVDRAYTNLVLPAAIRHYGLEGRDAAFATELASGTIRRRGTYDAILAACTDRPLSKVEAKVLDALRVGTHQLVSMRVPAHAAISTTVDLVRARVNTGAGNFANAVLRSVSERGLDEWIEKVTPDERTSPTRYAEIAFSHPAWIVDELREAVGRAELHQLLAADNENPRVTLVARPGHSTRAELPGEPTPFSPYGVVLEGGDPRSVPAVAEGRAAVQDEGSQLVALAAAQAPLTGRDSLWLDLCAGPGGKAGLLAALAAERGASVVANERLPGRAGLVHRTLAATGGGWVPGATGVVAADGTLAPYRAGVFDRVLVDAPCTGLGALRRRPEARWRRKADDVVTLVMLQRQLVRSALDLVRPGGVVLYATCSPVISETSSVVTSVNGARADAELVSLAEQFAHVPRSEGPVPGTVQLWPHRHGTDAMFMALFRRVA